MRYRMPRIVALVAISFSLYGCSKKKAEPSEAKPATPATIPAPKGLVAEIVMANPAETWAKVRDVMGGPLALVPAQAAMFATTAFDLPPTAAEQFDMNIPAVGAIIDDGGRFAAVMAFHVKDGPKLAEIATTGDSARYVKKPDDPSGVVLLEPKQPNPGPALGISGNYLTVASRSSDLTRFAPFVTTVLSSRPAPKEDVVAVAPREGLAHLVSRLESKSEQAKQELVAMDAMLKAQLGPDAVSVDRAGLLLEQLDRVIAVASDLEEARFALALEGDFVRARLAAKAKDGDGAASEYLAQMAQGDAKPLLDLPLQSAIGIIFRDTREARQKAVANGLAALDAAIEPAQKEKIEETLRAHAEARGDAVTLGAFWDNGNFAIVGKAEVQDRERFAKVVPEMLKVFGLPGFAQSFENIIGPFKLGAPSAKAGVHTARLTRTPKAATKPALLAADALPTQFDIVWAVENSAFLAVAPKDAKKALETLKSEGGKLSEHADVANLVGGVDDDVAFALLVRPLKIMSELTGKPVPDAAPMLVSAGRSANKEAVVRIDIHQQALRDIVMLANTL